MESSMDFDKIVAEKDARIAELEALVKFYEEQFRLSKSREFGPSSEKNNLPEQLGLFDEIENTADAGIPEPELEQITYTRKKKAGRKEPDLSELPVETIEYTLSEEKQACPNCENKLHVMGHNERKEIHIIPAQAKVVVHRQAVYSCRCCERTGISVPIVKADMPEALIKGSMASPSSVAHIMAQKYVMCAPLYRQEQEWKSHGLALSRQTMSNWVIKSTEDRLLPIYERLKAQLLTRDVLHADETTVQVLREPGKKAQSKSYMWLYRTSGDTDKHIVYFEYKPDRKSANPEEILRDFKGYLHTDGYAAYHKLPDITVIGCWAHMRRKFEDALKSIPKAERASSAAVEALWRIGKLFHLEGAWIGLEPDERYKCRIEKSKPLADGFFEWLSSLNFLPLTAMGRAIGYALDQKLWLMNFYLDGRTELSNNRAENSIRPFTLGRKNWLFNNTVKGANTSSIIYSLIETAKANGLIPFEYLKYLLETVPGTATDDINDLLPWSDKIPMYCRTPDKRGDKLIPDQK
jgi:transposase